MKSIIFFVILVFSTSAFPQLRLLCDVEYKTLVVGDKQSVKSRVQLNIDTRNGQYWKRDARGQIEFIKMSHLYFEVLDSDVDLKFAAIPENEYSYLFDESDDVVYKFRKRTVYKTGSEKLEGVFLDRLTGKFEIYKDTYFKVPGRVTTSYKVLGICSKGDVDLKF